MFLIQKVEELIVTYNDGRKSIGEFILTNFSTIQNYSIDEIAKKTRTSKASIVRFAKTLGYEGWKDLKRDLIREQKVNFDLDFNYPFQEGDDVQDIAKKLANVQTESIMDTFSHLDLETMMDCTDHILNAKKIIMFGVAPNTSIAQLFQRKMLSIGKVVEIADFREMGMNAKLMNENDFAIIISYSGNNAASEPVNIVSILNRNNVPILAITSGGDNYLRMHTDFVLTLCSRERLYTKIANFASEQSLLYVLNVLFACCFERNYEENDRFKQQSARELEQSRLKNYHKDKE
ncbi:hypothetical protein C815_01749 [Firmicutes bacterium M10-2]|nr:hypothetical protein C815_01749 [Firmicutes bacterium M10-2]